MNFISLHSHCCIKVELYYYVLMCVLGVDVCAWCCSPGGTLHPLEADGLLLQ